MVKTGSLLISLLLIVCSVTTSAQNSSWKDNLYFGGNGWVEFGDPTLIVLTPTVGYKLSDVLSIGINGTYQYRNFRRLSPAAHLHDYGVGIFGRNYFTERFFGQVEYNYLTFQTFRRISLENIDYNRQSLHSALVGGGMSYPVGKAARFSVVVLYNLTHDRNGPFDSPVTIRGGFSVGL